MIIKVDYREKSFIQKYEELFNNDHTITTISFQTTNLDLGDIHICDDNNNIILIFERKTVNDLMSSIKDGRYKEQSYRLNSLDIHNHSIIYIIEGTVYNGNIHNNIPTLYSAMCSLQVYKGFSIFKTNNVRETIEYIYFYACKLHKEGNKPLFYSGEICNNTSKTPVGRSATEGWPSWGPSRQRDAGVTLRQGWCARLPYLRALPGETDIEIELSVLRTPRKHHYPPTPMPAPLTSSERYIKA
jgi:hypothetical protein